MMLFSAQVSWWAAWPRCWTWWRAPTPVSRTVCAPSTRRPSPGSRRSARTGSGSSSRTCRRRSSGSPGPGRAWYFFEPLCCWKHLFAFYVFMSLTFKQAKQKTFAGSSNTWYFLLVIEINQIFTALQIKLRTKTLMIIKTLIATSDSLTASITTQSTDNGEDHIQLRYFW